MKVLVVVYTRKLDPIQEKIGQSAELSELLGLPHAIYELATFKGERGTVSPSFVPEGGSLTFGNEILARIVPEYLQEHKNPSQHTVEIVLNAIGDATVNVPINWTPPVGVHSAAETFVGYLLLDAWIGNTDRHHENWAFIIFSDKAHLAPTYDHASSLARELLDEKRLLKLQQKSVTAYVEKCTSAIYACDSDKKPLKTFDAFSVAAGRYPNAARIWLDYLARVSTTDTLELFHRIPGDRISLTAIEFAQKMLQLNQSRLLNLRDTLS